MLSSIRIELGDVGIDKNWTEDELCRAVDKSVALMSRIIPDRGIAETTLKRRIDGETLTVTNGVGKLKYIPVEVDTLLIAGKVHNIDYTVNHITGEVNSIDDKLIDDDYSVSYSLDTHLLYLKDIIKDYIRIERIEYNKVNPVAEYYGDYVNLRNVTLEDNKVLRLIYLKKWDSPTITNEGNFPSHLNDAVIIGSTGQALIYKAETLMRKAVDELNNIGKVFADIDAEIPDLPTVTPPNAPTISKPNAPNSYTLDMPTLDSFPQAPSPPSAEVIVFDDFNNAYEAIAKELDDNTINADDLLEAGESLINAATRGERPSEVYNNYAITKVNMAQIRLQSAAQQLQKIETKFKTKEYNLNWYTHKVNIFVAESNNIINAYKEQVNAQVTGLNKVAVDTALFQAEIQNENLAISKFSEEVRAYQVSASMYEAKLNAYNTKVTAALQRVNQTNGQIASYLDVAGRYLASGQSKIQEMLVMLNSKLEFTAYKGSDK